MRCTAHGGQPLRQDRVRRRRDVLSSDGAVPAGLARQAFDKPVRAWAAGVTGETTRDVVQAKLIGPPFNESEWGTGMIPKACLASIATARGIPSAIDTVGVKHASGGMSMLQFKSFERGREKWQGAACGPIKMGT